MKKYIRGSLLFIILCTAIQAFPQQVQVKKTQPPAWIQEVTVPLKPLAKSDKENGESVYLLSDEQINFVNDEYYFHYIYQLISYNGVQNSSEFWITYDPSYQEVVFHKVLIHRNGITYDRLAGTDFKSYQDEPNIDAKLYNAQKTIGAFFHDIRINDIVEISYSIRGRNPVFNRKIFGNFDLQYTVPAGKIFRRLVCEKSKELNIRSYFTDAKEVKSLEGDRLSFQWELDDAQALYADDFLPSWYYPLANVHFSEFNNWAEILDWADPLFPEMVTIDQALTAKIGEFKTLSSDEAKILEAIHFVQDEVRYVGIDMGTNSYKPHHPNEVFKARYGDCKDKSYLLVILLRKLGFTASIALVNTYLNARIADYPPSPINFNHAIVVIEYQGKSIWVDPTISLQRGPLAQYYCPPYGLALVINKKYNDLQTIPENSLSRVHYTEEITVKDSTSPALFTIIGTYYSGEADMIRQTLASGMYNKLQDEYLKYYSQYYPRILAQKQFEVKDLEDENIITISEYYEIPGFWTAGSGEQSRDFTTTIYAFAIRDILQTISEKKRIMPLDILYPKDITEEITFNHSQEMKVKPESGTISNESCTFDYAVHIGPNKNQLIFKFHYLAKSDHVKPENFDGFLTDIGKMKEYLSYTITWGIPAVTGKINWLVVFICMLVSLGLVFLGIKLYRRDRNVKCDFYQPMSVGGWMILPMIGLFLAPYSILSAMINSYRMFDAGVWAVSMNDGTGLNAILLILEVIACTALINYSVFLAIMMIRRRTIFPIHYMYYRFGIIALYLILIYRIDPSVVEKEQATSLLSYNLGSAIIGAAIWIPYMFFSFRAKNAFVFRFDRRVEYKPPLMSGTEDKADEEAPSETEDTSNFQS